MNTENNILIAEFLGMKTNNLGWYDDKGKLFYPNEAKNNFHTLLFDTEWNWLMSAIREIKSWNFTGDFIAESWDLLDKIDNPLLSIELEYTYNAVIEFIKWHNENSAKKD